MAGLTTTEVDWSNRLLNPAKDTEGVCTDTTLEQYNAEAAEEDNKLLA